MLKTIDLFAGAGGLSLGFQLTGKFDILAAAEINKNAKATYKANIAKDKKGFVFIDNVVGYDFRNLNEQLGGIDVVIGGPPCQGFSNANRQKSNLISMNNGLVKEFFRAIKEIKPKAFIMENVGMLRSDTHRFYESEKDNDVIAALTKAGFDIPTRKDSLHISKVEYEGIDFANISTVNLDEISLPADLLQLISVLLKNIENERRLPTYLEKHTKELLSRIERYITDTNGTESEAVLAIRSRITIIKEALLSENIRDKKSELEYIVSLQKMISTIFEIRSNGLIGEYSVKDGALIYTVNSYSVIDYVNAILGGEYIQTGKILNAEWFGVPQERRRYIVMGIRKDIYPDAIPELPNEPDSYSVPTVGEAIMDLKSYPVGYGAEYTPVPYSENDALGNYAKEMRKNSTSVKNHITTSTTETAKRRFEQIKQGKNFHSLSSEMKDTYAKPERTQNTIYLRLDPNLPSGTVVNVRKSMWIHPTLDRAITVREAARLQSFPDTFEFIGTKDSQYQQVGNAVPPLLAKGIAETLLTYIE